MSNSNQSAQDQKSLHEVKELLNINEDYAELVARLAEYDIKIVEDEKNGVVRLNKFNFNNDYKADDNKFTDYNDDGEDIPEDYMPEDVEEDMDNNDEDAIDEDQLEDMINGNQIEDDSEIHPITD